MSLMYSASEHVSTRTHKWACRLSSAFAHSRRPRARPSCCRAFLITCYTAVRRVGRQRRPHAHIDGEIDGPGARLLHSFYPLEPQQQPLVEQQPRLERHLQRQTSYEASAPPSAASAAGHRTEAAQAAQIAHSHFFVYYFVNVIDVVFRSRRCKGKRKEKLRHPWSVYIRGNVWRPNTVSEPIQVLMKRDETLQMMRDKKQTRLVRDIGSQVTRNGSRIVRDVQTRISGNQTGPYVRNYDQCPQGRERAGTSRQI